MGKLLKTDIVDNHYHVAYINNDGIGYTSEDEKHSHKIAIINEQQMVMDPNTGQPAIDPNTGQPIVNNSQKLDIEEVDGHTHKLEEIDVVDDKDITKIDKHILLSEDIDLVKKAIDIERDSINDGQKSIEFYKGEQWDKKTRNILEFNNRACITQNEIKPRIDVMSGFQRQNRYDIKFLPTEEGDHVVADILNIVAKNICDNTDYEYEETAVFDDSLKVGRGNLQIYIDFNKNINGNISIKHIDWDNVFYGKHSKLDASDCEYVGASVWISFNKLKQLFPSKAEIIAGDFNFLDSNNKNRIGREIEGDDYDRTATKVKSDPDFINFKEKKVRLIELQKKIYDKRAVLNNFNDDFNVDISIYSNEIKEKAKNLSNFNIINRVKTRIRIDLIANNTVLDVKESLFSNFNIVPCYANKDGDYFWGKVENMKDPQRELNKKLSQLMDILNKVSTYGWFYDSETFDPKEEDRFKKNVSKPGFYQKVINTNKIPIATQGVRFPSELSNAISISQQSLSSISNIYPEMMGTSHRAESGTALAQKTRQGLIGNEYLFDNLSLSKKMLGRLMIEAIQKVYNPERIMRIIENKANNENVQLGNKEFKEYDKNEIMYLLETADLANYDIIVSEAQNSPSSMYANFIYLSELAGKGVPIPPTEIIKFMPYMDSRQKESLIQGIIGMQQAQAQQEQAKNNTEIAKTQIKAQSKMPNKQ